MAYKDIIFDLYGTLVDIHTEENEAVWSKTALYFRYHGADYSTAELKEGFNKILKAREAKAGQSYEYFPDIPFESIMEELFLKKDVCKNAEFLSVSAAQLFRICSTEYIKLYPNVKEALQLLRDKGCRLWLLSNAQRVFTEYELRALGLLEEFNGVYISSNFGFRKPDIRFFKALIENENLDKNNCIMVGNDRETDIAGAKNAGLATIYMHTNLTPPHQEKADLRLLPRSAPKGTLHFEFEGEDILGLAKEIAQL